MWNFNNILFLTLLSIAGYTTMSKAVSQAEHERLQNLKLHSVGGDEIKYVPYPMHWRPAENSLLLNFSMEDTVSKCNTANFSIRCQLDTLEIEEEIKSLNFAGRYIAKAIRDQTFIEGSAYSIVLINQLASELIELEQNIDRFNIAFNQFKLKEVVTKRDRDDVLVIGKLIVELLGAITCENMIFPYKPIEECNILEQKLRLYKEGYNYFRAFQPEELEDLLKHFLDAAFLSSIKLDFENKDRYRLQLTHFSTSEESTLSIRAINKEPTTFDESKSIDFKLSFNKYNVDDIKIEVQHTDSMGNVFGVKEAPEVTKIGDREFSIKLI